MKISTNIALIFVLVLSGCSQAPLPDTTTPVLENFVEDNQEKRKLETANERIIEPKTVPEKPDFTPTSKPEPETQQDNEVVKTQASDTQREESADPKPNPTPKPEPVVKENCHTSYSGCLKADASDYDCAQGSGNGPYYTGKVEVLGLDVFDLDRDNDGWGCE